MKYEVKAAIWTDGVSRPFNEYHIYKVTKTFFGLFERREKICECPNKESMESTLVHLRQDTSKL